MKKIVMIAAVLAAGVALAALSTANLRPVVLAAPQTVAAGASVTNDAVAVAGYKGLGEVCCAVDGVDASASNRIVTVAMQGTNTVSGGWYTINAGALDGDVAGVVRVPVQAEYLPPFVRVIVGSTETNSVVSGVLLAY